MNQLDIPEQKKAIRREIKEIKKRIPLEKLSYDSDRIFKQVESLSQFSEAKVVLAYWSLPDEVNTHDFVLRWAATKKMVLPIVVGSLLELREFNGLKALVTGSSFGIQEPHTGALVEPSTIDFAIIPGIAFDTNGNRLGRGKGYYDKILTQTNAYKVAVGFDFQIVSKVPVMPFDIPVDVVISTINQ
jgi:5-formyltetrahydrofolate cyclo-ligase